MKVEDTKFVEAKIITLDAFEDQRGLFKETFHLGRYIKADLFNHWAQDAVSVTTHKNTVRGLHYQQNMSKLVTVLSGKIYDVIVDIRKDSETYGEWQGFYLSGENHKQLFVPAGFAHGFLTLTDNVVFQYKMSEFYNPHSEGAFYYNSEELGIKWPILSSEVIISHKDDHAELFHHGG